jgi:hypothetical protein
MFAVVTHEVRWFCRGRVPGLITTWHKSLGGLYREHEPCADIYLLLPGNSGLGIKWREERIEFKKKMTDLGLVDIRGVTGKAELWKKWSFTVESGEQTLGTLMSDPENWVTVSKKRYLQLFAFSGVELVPHPGTFGEGETVMVELSDVEVEGSHSWTVGVEFSIQNDETKINIQDLVNRLLMDFPDLTLDVSVSFGYPQWLAGLLKS